MKTSVTSAIAVALTCRSVRGFTGHSSVRFRSSLRPTARHSFCPSSSTSTVGGPSTKRPRRGEPRESSRRAAGLRGHLNMFDATDLFQLQQWAGDVSATELNHVSPLTIGVMYGTGLLMSLSPCSLSLLPLTISYIAGTEGEATSAEGGGDATGFESIKGGFIPSAAFAAGLATVLSLLGLSATMAGKVMGTTTAGTGLGATLLPLGASAFAVAMGLNVLELVQVDLPSFEQGLDYITSLPRNARAYLLGASSALVASPCCTPVLASILGFIGSSQDPALGLVLLLTYSAGYTTPLMAAGTASGVLSRLMSANGLTWITPASGAMLISYGTYNGLNALFG